MNEDVFVCAVEKDVFPIADLHDRCLQNDFLVSMQRDNSIVVFVAQENIILVLELIEHVLWDDPSKVVLKLDFGVLVTETQNLHLLSKPRFNEVIILWRCLEPLAYLFEILAESKLTDCVLAFGCYGVGFETIVHLKAVHKGATYDTSVVFELWD